MSDENTEWLVGSNQIGGINIPIQIDPSEGPPMMNRLVADALWQLVSERDRLRSENEELLGALIKAEPVCREYSENAGDEEGKYEHAANVYGKVFSAIKNAQAAKGDQ